MSTTVETDDRIDAELGTVPATLSEEQANLVQMQQLAEATVAPGLLRLPVSTVTTAANSPQWAIDVEHPVEGTLRIFRQKPLHGWSRDYAIVRMLDWYDIDDRDPYKLQTTRIYMRYTGDDAPQAHGWEAVAPPDYDPPVGEQLAAKRAALGDWAGRVGERFAAGPLLSMWLWLGVSIVTTPALFAALPSGWGVLAGVVALAWYCLFTVVGMAIGLHESGGDR